MGTISTENATPPDERRPAELLEPSKAYEQACTSLIYRLSELVFGSLLAAYILGFVGFAASATVNVHDVHLRYVVILCHLSISLTFAYLTASLYFSYHVSILTMPHLPFRVLYSDFFIALLQAVLFGLSMLEPPMSLGLIGLLLLTVLLRKRMTYSGLCDHIQLELERKEIRFDERRPSHLTKWVTPILRVNENWILQTWLPSRGALPIALFQILGGAAMAGYFIWHRPSGSTFEGQSRHDASVVMIVLMIAAGCVAYYSSRQLTNHAHFFADDREKREADNAYRRLIDDVAAQVRAHQR